VTKAMLLAVQDISKSFPSNGHNGVTALDGISLDVEKGQFISILGPSGCGKSTLLRLVVGLDSPSTGRIEFLGNKIEGPSRDRSLVFQSYGSFPWLSVRGNVEFGLKHSGIPNPERRERAAAVIRLVGLVDFSESLPHELSGGMQQRLALARSLAMKPLLLLLDEPFGAVDAITRKNLQVSLRGIVDSVGSTTILVTHDVEEAILLADRILVMTRRPGRIRLECADTLLATPYRDRSRKESSFQRLRHELTTYLDYQHSSESDSKSEGSQ